MTLLQQLSLRIGKETDVEWPADGELVGFTATIVDVREVEGQPGMIQVDNDQGYRYHLPADAAVAIKQPDGTPICPGCGASGFGPSVLGPDRCQFCDGTESGNPPAISPALVEAVFPIVTGHPPMPVAFQQALPAWFVAAPPPDFTPDGPDDPWRDEPLYQFISGTAGTGKTYNQKLRSEVDPRVKLTATTGIAAINLGGQTINSLLHYKDTQELSTQYELGRLNGTLGRLAKSGFRRLIIDEVSMMDGRQLDVLCEAIDRLNERLQTEGEPLMGITLVGDFCQLPPVKAPFVFERSAFSRFQAATIRLTEPRRQADPAFVHALQAVRRGDTKTACDYFASMIKATIDGEFSGSTIMAKNDEVDRHNGLRLMELPGRDVIFKAHRAGVQAAEWKNIPDQNKLKLGALVMILANKREPGTYIRGEEVEDGERKMIYANGDLGILEDVIEACPAVLATPTTPTTAVQTAYVRLHRTGGVVAVAPVLREYKKATGHKGVNQPREQLEGSISFMPLRVAYATTCHKSQGLSLDRVQVVMNNSFFGQSGMMYVALSRARTPEGLRLVGGGAAQLRNRIAVDPKVIPWL